jgi:hypothetical protein
MRLRRSVTHGIVYCPAIFEDIDEVVCGALDGKFCT